MSREFVDLHAHSTASDGTYAPAEVARLARRSGLAGFALTDHDTVAGVEEAGAEAGKLDLAFVPGIELSCDYPTGTMHLLGYGIDPHSQALAQTTRWLVEARNQRNPRMVEKLRALGVAIDMDEVLSEAGGEVVGRPHIAAVLVRKGYVSSIKHAFEEYLGRGASAYVEKERLAPARAIETIRSAGGVPVLAHPVQLRLDDEVQLRRLVGELVDLGLLGLEVIHSDHTPELVERYSRLAEESGLLKTGGSDFHGLNKRQIELGLAAGRRIPRQWMDDLLSRHRELAGAALDRQSSK